MTKIVATVGTSFLENYRKEVKISKIMKYFSKGDEPGYIDKPCKDKCEKRNKEIEEEVERWLSSDEVDKEDEKYQVSAEVKSLFKIMEKTDKEVEIHLFASDTIGSEICAKLIAEYIKKNANIKVYRETIEGLQIRNPEEFRKKGIPNLVEALYKVGIGEDENKVVLNITGGYKALIPYMVLIGQVYNVPIYYIFENADSLIEVPKAPIEFNFYRIEENYVPLSELRRKESNRPSIEEFIKEVGEGTYKELIKDGIITEKNGRPAYTFMGKLLVEKYEKRQSQKDIIGLLIELQLFKYLVKKFKTAKVIHRYRTKEGHEIDIFIEDNNSYTAIEIKPGGNVPIWKNKTDKYSIEHKIKEGGFKHLFERYKYKVKFEVYLYSRKKIHNSVVKQLENLCNQNREIGKQISFYLIKLPENYTKDIHWEIQKNNIEKIELA